MKKSKNFFVRSLFNFGKKYLPDKFYSLLLFIRNYKKFKKEITKKKSIINLLHKIMKMELLNIFLVKFPIINISLKLVLVIMSVTLLI